jgi:predicted PurR-regulated permease PerM
MKDEMKANIVSMPQPQEAESTSVEKGKFISKPNPAQLILALAAVLGILYFGKVVLVTLLFSVLLGFILEPLVGFLEHRRLPRAYGALLAMLLLAGILYAASYFFYVRVENFVSDLPKYSGEIKKEVLKFRAKADKFSETRQQIIPDKKQDKNTVTVKNDNTNWFGIAASTGTITEGMLAISFVPFLAYFMLTWQAHVRATAVKLFAPENRTAAYVTMSRISQMLRDFIVGNLVIGLIISIISVVAFALLHIPYFYFIGFISGYLSLVPYLGVLIAMIPPLAAGMGVLGLKGYLMVALIVFGAHLVSLNVLYPKMLGKRLQLNPLVVTVSLLIWGFIWGALGLILAIPVTAALKIVCDHVEGWQTIGELMGEGREESKT